MESGTRVALIPARGGSKGIVGKNLYPVGGKPLIYYSISTLIDSCIGNVYVSSDSSKILEVSSGFGAKTVVRGRELSGDLSSSDSVLLDFASRFVFDIYYLVQCTVPLLKSSTVDNLVSAFESSNYNSILTVCRFNKFWWRDNNPINYDPNNRPMRQQITEENFFETGAVYGIRREHLMSKKCRIGDSPMCFETSFVESIDIDSIDDLNIVDYIIRGGYDNKSS